MRENETRYTNYSCMQMAKNVFLKYVSVKVILEFFACNNDGLKTLREGFVGFGFFFKSFFPVSSMLLL